MGLTLAKPVESASKQLSASRCHYFGGGTWYTLDIDYAKVAAILKKHNYRGYVSLEFEGKEDFTTAVPKSLDLIRKAFAA